MAPKTVIKVTTLVLKYRPKHIAEYFSIGAAKKEYTLGKCVQLAANKVGCFAEFLSECYAI